MRFLMVWSVIALVLCLQCTAVPSIGERDQSDEETSLHFGYHTENGHKRTEDIKYNMTSDAADQKTDSGKSVEYRGGYSFVSADGYEYTVLYKANKNGFQPYVTAKKIQKE